MVLLAWATFAAVFGHQVLLPVVPLYVAGIGGGSEGAGLTTGLFMLSTVLTQIQMPRLIPRLGYRASLGVGSVFLGAPAFLYLLVDSLVPVLTVTFLRGIGFGMVTVVFFALMVEVAPPERRGEALGVLGVAITIPTVFCSALALWLAENVGFPVVFLMGAVAPLFGVVSALGIGVVPVPRSESGGGFFAGLARGPLLRVVVIFSSVTVASGVIFTFLPLSAPGANLFSATGALLFLGLSATFFRWWGGRLSDRHGPTPLLFPGLAFAALGMALLATGGVSLLLGAALFGAGYGLLQNSTLLMMMERVSKSEYGLGSTLWNAAFDAGAGVGAFMFGFVIASSGFTQAYFLCAALLICAMLVVSVDRRRA